MFYADTEHEPMKLMRNQLRIPTLCKAKSWRSSCVMPKGEISIQSSPLPCWTRANRGLYARNCWINAAQIGVSFLRILQLLWAIQFQRTMRGLSRLQLEFLQPTKSCTFPVQCYSVYQHTKLSLLNSW